MTKRLKRLIRRIDDVLDATDVAVGIGIAAALVLLLFWLLGDALFNL